MAKRQRRSRGEPIDVDAVLAKAASERQKADPYYRPPYRSPWDPPAPPEPVVVRRNINPQNNQFTSARERKAAKAAQSAAANKRRKDKGGTSKKSA